MSLTVTPYPEPVGAEVGGIDLNADIDEATFGRLRELLDRHSLLVFRGQRIEPQRQVAFTRRFGRLKTPRPESQWLLPGFPDISRLSNIHENGKPIGILEAGQYWHTDRVYEAVPNGYAFLHAIEIPHDEAGNPLGGTMFVSTAHAYDTLDDATKARIGGLRATHSMSNNYGKHQKAYKSHEDELPPVDHPVVRTHPRTGRKCLYVSKGECQAIEGMDAPQALALIDELADRTVEPRFRHTHRWRVRDLLMWDNCAVQHLASFDYQWPRHRRLMQRITVGGSVPC